MLREIRFRNNKGGSFGEQCQALFVKTFADHHHFHPQLSTISHKNDHFPTVFHIKEDEEHFFVELLARIPYL
jgi:hypothetical protein